MAVKSYNDIPRVLELKVEKLLEHAKANLNGTLISPYQPKGVKFMIQKELSGPGCILADEMGLGKTVMTVSFILGMKHHYEQLGTKLPTLVVAPKSCCQQWVNEIQKFSKLTACLYDKSQDIDASSYDVIVVSFSFFTRDSCLSSSIFSSKFQRVILDEAHLIKNPNTVSSKNIRAIKCDKKLCLSGTPIQNDPKDLFSLVRWIFKDDQQKLTMASRGVSLSSRSKEKKQMCTEFIRDCILMRRTLDDVSSFNKKLSLPNLDVRILSIPFHSNEEADLYSHVQALARERIQNVLKSSSYNTQSNMDILEALLRCRQVCIHPALFLDALKENPTVAFKWGRVRESGAGHVSLLHNTPSSQVAMPSTKLETLVSLILAQPPEDKTLIFSSFVKEMRIIQKMLQNTGVSTCWLYYGDMSSNDREMVLEKFKKTADQHAVLIIQMNAGGTGLNLQEANRCYVTSPAYNPSLEMQCIARSHRTGQSKPVTCIRLVMQNSVEEKILDIQNKKLMMISKAFDDERIMSKLATESFALSRKQLASMFDIKSDSSSSASSSSSDGESVASDSDDDSDDSFVNSERSYRASEKSGDMSNTSSDSETLVMTKTDTSSVLRSSICANLKTCFSDAMELVSRPAVVVVDKQEEPATFSSCNKLYDHDINMFDDL